MKKNNKRSAKASDKKTNVNESNGSENSQSAQSAQFAQPSGKNDNSTSEGTDYKEEKRKELIEAFGKTPTLPDHIFHGLPEPLRITSSYFSSKRERDIYLLSAITVISGVISNVSGVYDGRVYYPNLYLFVIAPPASGKGVMSFSKAFAQGVHDQLMSKYEEKQKKYFLEYGEYKKKKKKDSASKLIPPKKPDRMGLFIPANSSSASVTDLLRQFGGRGIIFETEADTLGTSFKQDWGNFSDVLRNAFHHEPISNSRKENDEYSEIKNPKLSVAISGTPSQVKGILKNIEDGLVSRFMYYSFRSVYKWKDVSPSGSANLAQIFNDLAYGNALEIANYFEGSQIKFTLTDSQWASLNKSLGELLETRGNIEGDSVASIITRTGLMIFRIAMVLSALRNFDFVKNSEVDELICQDVDFAIAKDIIKVLDYHAMATLLTLPTPEYSELNLGKKKFMDSLPSTVFQRSEALKIGLKIGIKERTVGKYLKELVDSKFLTNCDYGKYSKKQV